MERFLSRARVFPILTQIGPGKTKHNIKHQSNQTLTSDDVTQTQLTLFFLDHTDSIFFAWVALYLYSNPEKWYRLLPIFVFILVSVEKQIFYKSHFIISCDIFYHDNLPKDCDSGYIFVVNMKLSFYF